MADPFDFWANPGNSSQPETESTDPGVPLSPDSVPTDAAEAVGETAAAPSEDAPRYIPGDQAPQYREPVSPAPSAAPAPPYAPRPANAYPPAPPHSGGGYPAGPAYPPTPPSQTPPVPVQTPYYPQPGYYPAPPYPARNTDALGILSLVLGILGIVFTCFPFINVALSLAALILGIVARARHTGGGMAIAGIVLGAVGLIFGLWLVLAVLLGEATYTVNEWNSFTAVVRLFHR